MLWKLLQIHEVQILAVVSFVYAGVWLSVPCLLKLSIALISWPCLNKSRNKNINSSDMFALLLSLGFQFIKNWCVTPCYKQQCRWWLQTKHITDTTVSFPKVQCKSNLCVCVCVWCVCECVCMLCVCVYGVCVSVCVCCVCVWCVCVHTRICMHVHKHTHYTSYSHDILCIHDQSLYRPGQAWGFQEAEAPRSQDSRYT